MILIAGIIDTTVRLSNGCKSLKKQQDMKKKLNFLTFTLWGLQLFGQTNNPTLKETAEWMSSKVEGQYFSSLNSFFNLSLTWDAEKKVMKYTSSQTVGLLGPLENGNYVNEFDPKNIDPKSIYISDKGSSVKIHFSCNNGTGCIKSYHLEQNEKGDLIKEDGVNWKAYDITLYSDVLKKNENLPDRFIEAFRHLIKLRGGTGEKF